MRLISGREGALFLSVGATAGVLAMEVVSTLLTNPSNVNPLPELSFAAHVAADGFGAVVGALIGLLTSVSRKNEF